MSGRPHRAGWAREGSVNRKLPDGRKCFLGPVHRGRWAAISGAAALRQNGLHAHLFRSRSPAQPRPAAVRVAGWSGSDRGFAQQTAMSGLHSDRMLSPLGDPLLHMRCRTTLPSMFVFGEQARNGPALLAFSDAEPKVPSPAHCESSVNFRALPIRSLPIAEIQSRVPKTYGLVFRPCCRRRPGACPSRTTTSRTCFRPRPR